MRAAASGCQVAGALGGGRCNSTATTARAERGSALGAARGDRRRRRIILQGNSSAVAAALVDAVNKHNEREPQRRVLFLNYSAVDPVLTNERCSFWHFRFDAHADMRMAALMTVLKDDSLAQAPT
jgi:branched-chain amino acid transport system substrate-binding protein